MPRHPHPSEPDRSPLGRDAGVSLIEVVVAAVLVAILASVVLAIILQTQSAELDNRARVSAASLASREIDMVTEDFHRTATAPVAIADAGVVTNPHQLNGGPDGPDFQVNGTTYTITRSATWKLTGTGASACEGGGLVAYPALQITVAVSWGDMGSTKPVVSTTTLAPEKGTGIPTTDSFIAVAVVDAHGDPNVGRTVRVTSGATVKTGTTDGSGCAVIRVTPASGGSSYTASLGDANYVDITGNQTPSKSVGSVLPGQLKNNVTFQYDLGGTIKLSMTDASGTAMSGPLASPTQVTLIASQYAGSSGATMHTVTDAQTTLPGRYWPTQYGAYLGSSAPAGGYVAEDLTAGGTVTIPVVLAMSSVTVTGAPAGSSIIAVPHATGTTCTTAGAQGPFATGSPHDLMPGGWDLFAVGPSSGPGFSCSPGPSDVTLAPGGNTDVAWGTMTLTVTGAPAGELHAVDLTIAGSGLTTCPTGTVAARAWTLNPGVPTALPAGTWYLYVTDATGGCTEFMNPASNPVATTYDEASPSTTVVWPVNTVKVTVTGVERFARYHNATVYLTTSSTPICSASGLVTPGFPQISLGEVRDGRSAEANGVPVGTWNVYGNDENSPTYGCELAGVVKVGPASSDLTIDYSTSAPVPQVGP